MKTGAQLAEAYRSSPVVEKAKTRRVLVLDKDGTIASGQHPTEGELTSRKRIREIGANYVEIASTFRTMELGMSPSVYAHSVRAGFDRPPPQWLLPDGTRTAQLDRVDAFRHLLDFDAINSAGVGIGVRKNGGYFMDSEYDTALGGKAWRVAALERLYRLFPDKWLERHLAPIEYEHNYRGGFADVWPLPYRIQLDFQGSEGYQKKEELAFKILADEMRGGSLALVDESNPSKDRYTTYLMPKFGTKERSLERLLAQITLHSEVPLAECEVVMAGDTMTDLRCGLYAAQGAKEVTFVVAGGSRLANALRDNQPAFAGVPMIWSRTRQGALTHRSTPTSIPGVYYWRAHRLMRPRRIILADYAPWSRGLVGAESVLACLEEIKW